MEKQNYIAPEVEVFEVKVEEGFAQSGGEGMFDTPDGQNGSEYWL